MRLVPALLLLGAPGPLFAQGWTEHASRADFFSVNLPCAPSVEETTWTSGDPVRVRCHRLKDGSDGCLPGFVTPLHGDPARGHGVEKEWD